MIDFNTTMLIVLIVLAFLVLAMIALIIAFDYRRKRCSKEEKDV